jgi:hypothetical protein
MKRLVLVLLLAACAAPAAAKPAKPAKPAVAAAPEKPTAAAFHAAFGKGDSVLLKKQGQLQENIRYTPGELVQAPFGPVLLSPGEVEDASHVNSGKLAIVYLKPSAKGFEVVRKFVPAVEVGSFGKIVDWSVSRSFGDYPVVSLNGAGNWQGYKCSSTTLVELRPEGPRQLVKLPMTYDDSAAAAGKKPTQITGTIDNIQPGKSFEVAYFGFGSKDFTERYVRKGDAYSLASGVKSRMQSC